MTGPPKEKPHWAGTRSGLTIQQCGNAARGRRVVTPSFDDLVALSGHEFWRAYREMPWEEKATFSPSQHETLQKRFAEESPYKPGINGSCHWRENSMPPPKQWRTPAIVGLRDFLATMDAPHWVINRLLQRSYLYALTAFWGHGKTAILVTVALSVASGRAVGELRSDQCKVLFLCGENVADTKLRVKLTAESLGIASEEIEEWIFFTEAPFPIDDPVAVSDFVDQNVKNGPFGLVVVDTGPAHSDAEEENDNRQMHNLAMGLRSFLRQFGDPCLLVAMHPAKSATKDTMQPRGGGAFSGAIDGELCCWLEGGLVEFYHRAKFRGPGFKPIAFRLEKRELAEVLDNFGNPVVTVVAMPTDERPVAGSGRRSLKDGERIALDALRRCIAERSGKAASVPSEIRIAAGIGRNTATLVETWRAEYYAARGNDTTEAKRKAFGRARDGLQAARIIALHDDFAWILGEPLHATASDGRERDRRDIP
jgi:AAA domain